MPSLEAQEQFPQQPAASTDSIGGKLLADVHGWFEHQSTAAKTAEVVGAVALGAAAGTLIRGKLHSLEFITKATHLDGAMTELERQAAFAGSEYLTKAYILSPGLEQTVGKLAQHLTAKYPEFNSIVVAGGQANGSFVLRSLSKAHPGSDLDFYLVGHATTPERLQGISQNVQLAARANKLTLDGTLNGINPEIYLNLDNLEHHIQNQDYNLLALPFQAAYGEPAKAQLAVVRSVIAHSEKNTLWQQIVDAHAQSLSMHHGTWSLEFNNLIMHDFLPQKIEKFGLPESPETLLKDLTAKAIDRP
jgi:hypothetical protein